MVTITEEASPWNPGIRSQLRVELRPLCTDFPDAGAHRDTPFNTQAMIGIRK
jgi:hypothetical protein